MEPFHGLFRAAQGRLQPARHAKIPCRPHLDAKIALDQLKYAVPWFDTFNTVAVRKAMEDQVQAILSRKRTRLTRSLPHRRLPTSCRAPMSSRPRSRPRHKSVT